MARSDLLMSLIRAASKGDQVQFRRAVEAIIAEERAMHHTILADRLSELLATDVSSLSRPSNVNGEQVQNLLYEMTPHRSFDNLILPRNVLTSCRELVEEHHRADLLRSYALEPRHRIILVGPPGNGKTSLAEALANELMVPFYSVRYEGVIGSYLGETAQRLRKIFDYIRTRHCMLFLDEFDTLGKERGDVHETGEIKRVVSSLLLQMDALPSHVVVVTATNHPELLDRAVWRRFQLRVELPLPDLSQIVSWLERYFTQFAETLGRSITSIAKPLVGLSFAEIEEFGIDIRRRYVLGQPGAKLSVIISERLQLLQERHAPSQTKRRNSHAWNALDHLPATDTSGSAQRP